MVVPVMHVQGYSMKEIYEKNLYFLIPFFPLRYEKSIEHIANNCLENLEEYDKIYSELKEFTALFYDAYIHNKLSEKYTRERTRAENAETLLNKANAELDSANAELVSANAELDSANAYIKELEAKLALNK